MKNSFLGLLLLLSSIFLHTTVKAQARYIQIEYNSTQNGKLTTPYTSENAFVALLTPEGMGYISSKDNLNGNKKNNQRIKIITSPSTYYEGTILKNLNSIWFVDSLQLQKIPLEQTEETKKILGYTCTLYQTTLSSNRIQAWVTKEIKGNVGPNLIGVSKGVVLEFNSNNTIIYTAAKITKSKLPPASLNIEIPKKTIHKTEYSTLQWQNGFTSYSIFDSVILGYKPDEVYSDGLFYFSNGAVALREITFPNLENQLVFLEVEQKAIDDAYDRTGTVFLITEDQIEAFKDALKTNFKSFPDYPLGSNTHFGTVAQNEYAPPFELMRFFTTFGVHYPSRLKTFTDKPWVESSVFKQDISEYKNILSGKKVYIGISVGTWTKNGHQVSATLTTHPEESVSDKKVIPLFFTLPILEMQGNEYPHHFRDTNGIEVEFELKNDEKEVTFRYTTTGHGGYTEGDEFQPKINSIYLDDVCISKIIPWKQDCGSYRNQNPSSGDFSNGLSSSDLSRSNWCPGQVTNPYLIPLGALKAGKHKIRITIPEAETTENAQSMWYVSGQIIY